MSSPQELVQGYFVSPQQMAAWKAGGDALAPTAITLRLTGAVAADEIEEALKCVIRRHEILRSTFPIAREIGTPIQVVHDEVSLDWQMSSDAIVRANLHKSAMGGWELRLFLPALVADAHSANIIARELAASLDHASPETDEVPQYAQYVEYVHQWRESDEGEWAAAEWNKRDTASSIKIPFLRDVAPAASPESVELQIPSDIMESLDALCDRAGVAPEAFWFAGWCAVLVNLAGQEQGSIAVETSGRTLEETNDMPGAFSRCLPVSVTLQPGEPFLEFCRRMHSNWIAAVANEDAASCSERSGDIRFSWLDARGRITVGDFCIDVADVFSCPMPVTLRLAVLRTPEVLKARIDFNPSAITREEVDLIGQYFCQALRYVTQNPDSAFRSRHLVNALQREQLLYGWNQTHRSVLDGRSFPAIFRERATAYGSQTALQQGARTITYAGLLGAANASTAMLGAAGIGPEHVVGVSASPCIETVLGVIAILNAGAAFLPVDFAQPADRVRWMLEQSGTRFVLCGPTERNQVPDGPWSTIVVEPNVAPGPPASIEPDPLNTAYIIYTSGSTGRPKGVVVSHASLTNYLDWCAREYAGSTQDVALHSPLAFDLSITSLLVPLLLGKTLHVPDTVLRADALISLLKSGAEYDWIKLTPSHARAVQELVSPQALARTRMLILGGEGLSRRDVCEWAKQRPDAEIVNEYGPTEATVGCMVYRAQASDLGDGPVPIGRPLANARIYVLDETMEPVPVGAPGEIWIGGDCLARGYLSAPELTADRFRPDPHSSVGGSRVYRTGDVGRFRPDEILEYLGREDHQVKIRGYRVELGEVEFALTQHPLIREAVVLATPRNDDTRLTAFLTRHDRSAAEATPAELRDFLSRSLPEYMIPQTYVALDALPLNANGKADRKALAGIDLKNTSGRGQYCGPRSLEEEVLATIFARVLGLDRVGIDDNYFLLGGDSIRAIQIAGLAVSAGLHASLDMVFRHQTVRELAAALTSSGQQTQPATSVFSLVAAEDRLRLPDDAEDAYGLSRLQAGMVFERQLHEESAIYHDVFSHHLRMPLHPELLKQAVEELIRRHPMLRTSFHLDGFSEPLQIVHRGAEAPITFEDLSGLSHPEQRQRVQQWIEQEKDRGFDYDHPPLLRFRAHKTGPETFYFSLSFHHAILDGWSDATMLVELGLSYCRLLAGRPIGLQAPVTLYRDFIAAERTAVSSSEHRDYWLQLLEGATPTILPRWAQRSSVEKGRRGVRLQPVSIGPDRSRALQELARELTVPLKSVLLATHLRALGALAGTRDVVSTISSSGRLETEDGHRTIGLHINSTPYRLQLSGGRWVDLIRAVFDAEREGLPYRRYPMVEVQRNLGLRRLSETSFYYTHYHILEGLSELPSFEILDQLAYEETSFALVANFDLNPRTSEIALTLAYDQTEFSSSQMERIAQYFERALASIAQDPFLRYDAVCLAPADEASHLLALSEGAPVEPSADSIVSLFERCTGENPDALAVVASGDSLTYTELNRKANQLAHWLAKAGAGPEKQVALYLDRSPLMLVAMMGVLKAGSAYIPVDPAYPGERTRAILTDAGAEIVLTTDAYVGQIPANKRAVRIDTDQFDSESDVNPNCTADPDNLAYLIYTSGSTGAPKATAITRSNLLYSTMARFRYYEQRPQRFLLFSSYAFDSSVAGIFWTLTSGGTLVLTAEETSKDPAAISEMMRTKGISHLLALPSLYAGLLDACEPALDSWKVAIVAGQACGSDVVRRHYERFPAVSLFNEYGPTEATVWSTVALCAPGNDSVSIGRPAPGSWTYVLDSAMTLAALGAPGQLFIGGAGVARGYLNDARLTAERFLPDPFSAEPGARMYRTGDSVRYMADGELEYMGRVDWQVKIRGYRIEPEELEAAIRRAPGVVDAAVAARNSGQDDARLVAYVVCPTVGTPDAIRADLERRVPAYMVPSEFVFLDKLPKAPNGKLDRKALPNPEKNPRIRTTEYLAPRTEIEGTLADIWAQVLKVPQVGVNDDFFELGGDSILSIHIIARAKSAGVYIRPAQLFRERTIAKLTCVAERQPASASAAAAPGGGLTSEEIDDVIGRLTGGAN